MERFRSHILVGCLLVALHLTGVTGRLHNALLDLRFEWLPRSATGGVVMVAIDPPSLESVGTWPWPRTLHGRLVQQLDAIGVTDIVLDIDFSSASNPHDDRSFAEALRAAGSSVVLPSFEQRVGSSVHVTRALPKFAEHTWSALVNVVPDPDGIVRRYPFGGRVGNEFIPSMGALLAGVYNKQAEPFWVDFGIRSTTIPVVSFIDVIEGTDAARETLRGAKAIVGGTAVELGDRFNVANGRIVSGPALQALAAESILQGRALRPIPDWAILIMLGGLVALTWLLQRRLSPLKSVAVLAGVSLGAEAAAFLLQGQLPIIVTTSYLHIAVAGYLAALALDEIDFRGLVSAIAQTRFERIAMSLGDGLVCADRNLKITVWNPGAESVFGYQAQEIVGKPISTLFVGDDWRQAALPGKSVGAHAALPRGTVVELTGVRKSGDLFPLDACFSHWQGSDGVQTGAILRDISERKREAERIRFLAEFDTLTGLANRYTLTSKLTEAVRIAADDTVALLVVGIDKFQHINELQGHRYGDQVIRGAATRIKAAVAEGDMVARMGADEFAILITRPQALTEAEKIATAIGERFEEAPLPVGQRSHRIKVSIGIATCSLDHNSADEILGNAHLALSRAKGNDNDHYVVYERAFREDLQSRLQLEAELYLAVERGEFELFYQPQIRLSDGQLVGAEALIRWRHPTRGLLAPAAFMPTVNTSPVSEMVSNWVLNTACAQCRTWEQMDNPLRVAVNLSASQLQSGDLTGIVTRALTRTDCSPRLLELELTEDILLMNAELAIKSFQELSEMGVIVAFDDFGTGYASMSHLKTFPLNTLKIDKSFVMELWKDPTNLPIVSLIIVLCKSLGLTVIAEGVEDAKTAEQLALMGCDEGQGYHFSRPLPVAEFEEKYFKRSAAAVTAA